MKRKVSLIMGFILLGASVFFGVKFFLDTYSPTGLKTEQYAPESAPVQEEIPVQGDSDNPASGQMQPQEDTLSVDFEALQSINPDIYAWIEIPGTDISYPVLQDPDNDREYLRTNSDGEYSAGGAIFSEATYNSTDFNDPVTILYGHHMNAGNIMFGHLQDYFTDPEFLASDPVIRIYTPSEVLVYKVFAAVPFNSEHILYYNDMGNSEDYQSFFQTVMSIRELGAFQNEEFAPQDPATDRVLILSTCLTGNTTRRFLVMATLSPDQ